ncbi:hypothetical protein ACICHK_23345 [Streptomyces sp. AHU1]|uniref:hypothetical protein n=1 Tax=Streptomyces sp. AHU1 TaxID=3377215 RepID=UPI0038780EBD
MSRLSREQKRELKRQRSAAGAGGQQATGMTPIEVHVPASADAATGAVTPGAAGAPSCATVGGMPVVAAPGETVQGAILNYLHRLALATGHPVLASIHDERIGYVVPLQVHVDGSSRYTAEPARVAPPAQPQPQSQPQSQSQSHERRPHLPAQEHRHSPAEGHSRPPAGNFTEPPAQERRPQPPAPEHRPQPPAQERRHFEAEEHPRQPAQAYRPQPQAPERLPQPPAQRRPEQPAPPLPPVPVSPEVPAQAPEAPAVPRRDKATYVLRAVPEPNARPVPGPEGGTSSPPATPAPEHPPTTPPAPEPPVRPESGPAPVPVHRPEPAVTAEFVPQPAPESLVRPESRPAPAPVRGPEPAVTAEFVPQPQPAPTASPEFAPAPAAPPAPEPAGAAVSAPTGEFGPAPVTGPAPEPMVTAEFVPQPMPEPPVRPEYRPAPAPAPAPVRGPEPAVTAEFVPQPQPQPVREAPVSPESAPAPAAVSEPVAPADSGGFAGTGAAPAPDQVPAAEPVAPGTPTPSTFVLRAVPEPRPLPGAASTRVLRAVPESAGAAVSAPTGEFGPAPVTGPAPEPEPAPEARASAPERKPAPAMEALSLLGSEPDPDPDPDPKPTPARGFDAVAEAVLAPSSQEPAAQGDPASAFLAEPVARINEAVKMGRIEAAAGMAERAVAEAARSLGQEHPEVLKLRELTAYIAYLAGDALRSFHLSLDLARVRRRHRDSGAAYGNVQSAAAAWRAVRDPLQGLHLGRDLIGLWAELAADDGPAADDLEQLESARTRMVRLAERARAAADNPYNRTPRAHGE